MAWPVFNKWRDFFDVVDGQKFILFDMVNLMLSNRFQFLGTYIKLLQSWLLKGLFGSFIWNRPDIWNLRETIYQALEIKIIVIFSRRTLITFWTVLLRVEGTQYFFLSRLGVSVFNEHYIISCFSLSLEIRVLWLVVVRNVFIEGNLVLRSSTCYITEMLIFFIIFLITFSYFTLWFQPWSFFAWRKHRHVLTWA